MPTCKTPLLAIAAALALAWTLPGATPAAAQSDQNAAGDTPASAEKPAPAPASPATAPRPAPADRSAAPAPPAEPEPPTAPPRNLHKVGDHWTPYAPPDPESFPADATLHIIAPGETLWGLADLTYNNPWLWPQLWNENRYITDSHWIYPGDPLLVPARPVVVTQTGEAAGVPTTIVPQEPEAAPGTTLEPLTGPAEESGESEASQEAVTAPLAAESAAEASAAVAPATGSGSSGPATRGPRALVDRDEIRCSGYIQEESHRGDLFIAENEEAGYPRITSGSLVYLSRGRKDAQVQPGATFSIVEREGVVLHPVTGRTEGHYYKRNGEVRVLKVLDDTAIAEVTFACDEIRLGNELVPTDDHAVPSRPIPAFDRLRVERDGKATGVIVHTKDTVVHPATGDMVQIDLGREDGLAPGDFLTAFEAERSNRKQHPPAYHYRYRTLILSSADLHSDHDVSDFPAQPVGQLVVVSTQAHTSTAKVVHAVRELGVGMLVEVD